MTDLTTLLQHPCYIAGIKHTR